MIESYAGLELFPLAGFFTLLGFALLIMVAYSLFCSKSKSKEYRELMTDMYIIGLVKQMASKDGIDLIKELKEFARIEKKSKLRLKYLDEVLEDELKERIVKESEIKLEQTK